MVIEMEIQWKELTMEDEEVIKRYYDMEAVRNCEFTFANNILWEPFYEIQYAIIEDMLVFLTQEAEMSVSYPLGKGDIKKTFQILIEFFREQGRPFKMHLVSPAQFEKLDKLYPGRFQVEYDRDSADYVYESERLIKLGGKKLHAKRNHINRFKENFTDWCYERISDENVEECIQLADDWKAENGCADRGEKHKEYCVTVNALRRRDELGLIGGLIRAGGKVVAFSLGEPCGEDTFVVHIEKAYADIQGAYPIINQQFVENEASAYKYINREEDTGSEGLRKAKLSYDPAFLMKKGLVAESAEGLFQFLEESPSSYHAVEGIMQRLTNAGYQELNEKNVWEVEAGGKYYVNRNGSSLIAFRLPEGKTNGFHMIASHSDSPGFKLKENPEITVEDQYVKLNVEPYGGMIMSTWMDRPLSVAGRIVLMEDGKIITKTVNLDRDLLIIPNMAIHMNRDANKGMEYNAQTDMLPLFGGMKSKDSLMEMITEAAGVEHSELMGSDLYLYVRERGRILGAKGELISAPRLDDLQCVYASLCAFLQSEPEHYINVMVVYDNEEVGSETKQGAAGTFLKDVLTRICCGLSIDEGENCRMMADSFLISADNAHAVHPNHTEKSDPTNRPYLNKGIVIKYHGGQKYATDGVSAAVMKDICKRADVPFQTFANRSDMAGGSTLGNISACRVPVSSVDIGIPQLAMHSAYETAGSKDLAYMIRAMREFYKG